MSSPITYDATGWLSNQGPFKAARPWGRVIHTLECEAKPGIARELSAPGGYLDSQGLAPHGMSDPTQRVRACNTNRIGGHVGGRANPHVVGYEVSGRAAWTPAQWLDGGPRQAALESDARLIAWDCVQDGWTREEATRWLSGAQIKANYAGGPIVRGLLEHNDVSEFIGGTNHWDPGGFVPAWFASRIGAFYDELTGSTPPDNRTPEEKEWDDIMASAQDIVDAINGLRDQLAQSERNLISEIQRNDRSINAVKTAVGEVKAAVSPKA